MEENEINELKPIENRRNWQNSTQLGNFGKSGRPVLAMSWSRSAAYWRRGSSSRETIINFFFRTVQRLGNLADRVLTLLAI